MLAAADAGQWNIIWAETINGDAHSSNHGDSFIKPII